MSHKWVPLEDFACPVGGCAGNSRKANWVCAKDSTRIYISQLGYMRCNSYSCGSYDHYGQICTWRFDCGNHGDHPYKRFQYADYQGFSFALSQAVQLMDAAGATWVGSLCVELGKQYGRE